MAASAPGDRVQTNCCTASVPVAAVPLAFGIPAAAQAVAVEFVPNLIESLPPIDRSYAALVPPQSPPGAFSLRI
jgi:hypothetical protein